MKPIIQIVNMTKAHIIELADTMRDEDAHEAYSLGSTPLQLLQESYSNSLIRRTALVDGKVTACWGVCGDMLGKTGAPWLVTSKEVGKCSPITYAYIYREEVKKMAKLFPILENWVEASYFTSIRLLQLVGFEVQEALPHGPNNVLFRKLRWVA